ncbi:hypothetical protein GIB67_012215 [Kingdonia uniflora]|uniref:Hexosyltransferase n=1 Tax=Kingdonia uniflora TaxID=39325 RepID=A0A7J7NVA9_9MAGN|nr:hypothetical protein GIB67_012215 [Kingdonia uniflora]
MSAKSSTNIEPFFRDSNSEVKNESEHLDNLIKILEPSLTKDVAEHIAKGAANDIVNQDPMLVTVKPENGRSALSDAVPQPNNDIKKYDGDSTAKAFEYVKVVTGDELGKSCQLEFGSYCLWLKEHKEEMKDATVKKMKDKLFVARAYFSTIPKVPTQDKLSQNPPYLSFAEEFSVSLRSSADKPLRTEYISVFGLTHYLLSKIFQNLTKVIVLDEDIVVQRDLTPLWNLEMKGKVLGAVKFYVVKLGQLKSYLGEESFDNNSCTWMSGLNIVDLVKWRERNLTEIYGRLQLKSSTRVGALPATLLTFHGMVYALDDSWALSGLGHDYGIGTQAIKKAAVLHYNRKMKSWLELGISKYKLYWKKVFDTRGSVYGRM